jgi:hypothetical protein
MTKTRPRRPKACSSCNESEVKEIVYGMPTADLFDDPTVAIYGCVVGPGEPAEWMCATCGHEWRS